ncbi:MAG: hypothetical protein KIS92_22470 [Planctomycetota bacterium]|nr:hypothetical protein [Planctomycetota bacterium]
MATSVAILKYGDYQFSPVPQIGIRSNFNRGGESKTGPAAREKIVTLRGRLKGNDLNAIETKVAALEVALGKEEQVLYFKDGVTERINAVAHVLSFEMPEEWGQYERHYSITLQYIPLDDVHKAPALVSYGSLVICALNEDKPMPIFGREFSVERETPDSDRGTTRVQVSLTGFIEEGSITANLTLLNTYITAFQTDGGLLKFGNFEQTVNVEKFSHQPDTMTRRVAWSAVFSYSVGAGGPYAGVKKMSSSRRISRVNQRIARHFIPFIDHASVQVLGEGAQSIQATGFVVADTMANARAAAFAELEAQFPVGGYEESNSEVTEKESEARVEWSVSRFYPIPVLRGTIYGDA